MEWRGRQGSRNVEDRRKMGAGGAGGIGLVGMLAVLAFGYFFGVDISPLVDGGQNMSASGAQRKLTAEDQQMGDFSAIMLRETEGVFGRILPEEAGIRYDDPVMVLFSGATQSGCGGALAQTGPFYCPADRRIYLDTDFFRVLSQRMGAEGDLAAAYVIAHEVGHHVQNELGILPKVNQLRAQSSTSDSNYLSVLTELQADCFAGLWARNSARDLKITGEDVSEAMNAAAAVGDDTLMRGAGRRVVPDAFTHGSAADRQEWFMRGYKNGRLAACNTFKEAGL
ncbi:MAG: neutral zinc metallopeptidase [Paracoccus sp. (in: a-proteobacteria)]